MFLLFNVLSCITQTQTIWYTTQISAYSSVTQVWLHFQLAPPINCAAVVRSSTVGWINTHVGSSTGQDHFLSWLGGSPEVSMAGHDWKVTLRWPRGGRGKESGWERKQGIERKEKRERETASRADNFYFGPVVNSAWMSDKSTTQWQRVCVCVCAWGGVGGDMEGETALFRKGEHPANSMGAGKGGRERVEEKACDAGPRTAEPVLNKQQQCVECSSSTPTQSQATLGLTCQHTNPYFIITTAAPSRPCLRDRVCLWTCLRDYGGVIEWDWLHCK